MKSRRALDSHVLRNICLLAVFCWFLTFQTAAAQTIARCGAGWLEKIDGLYVLHLEGTPREMGYQHGRLLGDHARANLDYLLDVRGKKLEMKVLGVTLGPEAALASIVSAQRKYLPQWYSEELAGLAEGAGMPLTRVERANFIPELFHCSGFAVMDKATTDGTLYHGRVLDYAVDWKLQDHAVLIVAKPTVGNPSVNVSFAGFIGSVTGMNAAKISIGEMGGFGLGHWDGVPMAVLVRWALLEAKTLDEAVAVFRDHKRTCEYYYVIADGNSKRALGMEATWKDLRTVGPGEKHDLLPRPVPDAVLLSAGKRYHCLVDRVLEQHGKLDAAAALHLMDRGVAAQGNLHNVLFAPEDLRFWVSYAGVDRTPAADRPYQAFNLETLLSRQPNSEAPDVSRIDPATAARN